MSTAEHGMGKNPILFMGKEPEEKDVSAFSAEHTHTDWPNHVELS